MQRSQADHARHHAAITGLCPYQLTGQSVKSKLLSFAGVYGMVRLSMARWGVAAAALLGAPALAGAAPPATVAWSTYLRSGPGQTFTALSELEHDARVEVAGCAGGWCRVRDGAVQGYVDRDALTLPRTSPPVPPANTGCVIAGQADDRRPMPTRFCSAVRRGG